MQTVYVGNNLINDFYLGTQIITDVLRVDSRGYALPPVVDNLELYVTTYATQSYTSGSSTWNDLSGYNRNFKLITPQYWTSGSYNGLVLGATGSRVNYCVQDYQTGLPWSFEKSGSYFYVFKTAKPLGLSMQNFACLGSINNSSSANIDYTTYQRHTVAPVNNAPAFAAVYSANGTNTASLLTNSENTSDGLFHLVYAWWESQPAGTAKIGIDKNSPSAGSITAFNNSGSMRLSIGTNSTMNGIDNAGSAFYEIAYYSRKLTEAEITSSIDYFCDRYSIT